MDKRIKVLFWGDGVIETGFARVLHSIAKYLPQEKFNISWLAVNYFGDPHPYHNLRIYPASLKGDIYGLKRIPDLINIEKPDVIFILNDAWVQHPMLDAIKQAYGNNPLPKIVSYIPVDAKDHDPDWYANFDIVTHPVAYTEFGKIEIIKARPDLENKIKVINHGVDLSVFHPLKDSKEQVKKTIFPNRPDFYQDSFIVLNANRNQPRKRIDITMEAFKLFAEGKPLNVKLYLHMGVQDSHINISKMASRLGLADRLIITSLRNGVQTVTTERLNLIYNATDVGINTGLGEGWGLVNMEHAVTGAPQVVADSSALQELYYDCGLTIPTTMSYTLDNIMTTGMLVKPEDTAEKLQILYEDKELYKTLSKRGAAKFSSPEYSWREIAKQWATLFEV